MMRLKGLQAGLIAALAGRGATGTASGETMTYGASWTPEIRQVFFSDAQMVELRSKSDLTPLWNALAQRDREKVVAECVAFRQDADAPLDTPLVEGASRAKNDADSTDDAGESGNDAPDAADGTHGSSTATSASPQSGAGGSVRELTSNDMIHICALVEGF